MSDASSICCLLNIYECWLIPNCTNKTFDYLFTICIQWIGEELVMSTRDMIEGWLGVKIYEHSAHAHFSIWQNSSCVHRRLMFPWKVHQISLKTIFKELIFTFSVHVYLSEHTTAPVELLLPGWRYSAWQLLKTNYYILSAIRFLICLTEIEINLSAKLGLDLTVSSNSIWELTVSSAWSKIMVFWLVAFYVFTIISLFCLGFPHF